MMSKQSGTRWQGWLLLFCAIVLFVGGLWLLLRGGSGMALRILGVLIICAWGPLVMRATRMIKQETQPLRAVDRRYLREFTPYMAAYLLIMLFVWPHVQDVDAPWLKASLALSPTLPIALLIYAMVRYIIHSDEFQRRLHLEALAIAAGVVGVVSMVIGFLGAAKVIVIDGSFAMLLTYPALCGIYGLARCWLCWRYRGE